MHPSLNILSISLYNNLFVKWSERLFIEAVFEFVVVTVGSNSNRILHTSDLKAKHRAPDYSQALPEAYNVL